MEYIGCKNVYLDELGEINTLFIYVPEIDWKMFTLKTSKEDTKEYTEKVLLACRNHLII